MSFTALVLDIAGKEVGVREEGGPNRGARVETYQHAIGLVRGEPWCAAFVCWCFIQAATLYEISSPLHFSGSALRMWNAAPESQQTETPEVGAVFIIDHGAGRGHCGFVEHVHNGQLITIEGNTTDTGGREGDGVYRRIRLADAINVGFLVPSRSLAGAPPESHEEAAEAAKPVT